MSCMSVTITHQHLASIAGIGHWDKRDVKDMTPAFRELAGRYRSFLRTLGFSLVLNHR